MSTGWENHEPAPIEFLHGRMLEEFHKLRREKSPAGDLYVKISGSELTNIIAAAKRATYEKYPKQVSNKAIPKSEI